MRLFSAPRFADRTLAQHDIEPQRHIRRARAFERVRALRTDAGHMHHGDTAAEKALERPAISSQGFRFRGVRPWWTCGAYNRRCALLQQPGKLAVLPSHE